MGLVNLALLIFQGLGLEQNVEGFNPEWFDEFGN